MEIILSDSFYPLLENDSLYLLLCGGAGSGKSEFAGRKIFYRCMKEGGHCYLIMRKVRKWLKDSVVRVMRQILDENEVEYNYNKSDLDISFHGNELLFRGLDEPEKIKSIKSITSTWLEEATEFTKEDFTQIDLRLREPTKYYKQIMLSFNPDEAKAPWLKEMFFWDEYPKTGEGKKRGSYIHHSTVNDNPIEEVRKEYLEKLKDLDDATMIQIYRYGRWALPTGIIFNWDAVNTVPENPNEIFYGGDFGYSIDPAALVRIYRKANEFWLEEVIYETGLTNIELGAKMIKEGITKTDDTYWDSAEPKSIQELYDLGLNAKPAEKGPDSVKAGIDYLKSQKIHILINSQHIINERACYKWKQDKEGNDLPIPVDFKNHAMDAIRYGIYTHCKRAGVEVRTITRNIYPD